MLKCHEISALASDWLDGELTTGQKMKVRLHLMMCRHCRNLVDGLATTQRILVQRVESEAAIPDQFLQRTTSALDARLSESASQGPPNGNIAVSDAAGNDPTFHPLQETSDDKVLAIFDEIRQKEGYVPNLFRAYAHNPDLLEQAWSRVKSLMYNGQLSPRLKNAIATIVSQDNGCDYCVAHHKRMLKTLGVKPGDLSTFMATSEPVFLGPMDAALLQFAREANRNPHGMPPDLIANARAAGASDYAIMEAIGVMELYSSFNRMLDSLNVPLEPEMVSEL
ncbi:peroxidase-related enzyme [uncultured Halovibrio sp.]|uniref:peroxidase-related enzyme n=1 Tax=uncultured Halovibrio sp. TaxID=985049 RepID=UPI0025DDAF28|nr:peroxidase-related enzyme [uncultured Halovibrio sp.]